MQKAIAIEANQKHQSCFSNTLNFLTPNIFNLMHTLMLSNFSTFIREGHDRDWWSKVRQAKLLFLLLGWSRSTTRPDTRRERSHSRECTSRNNASRERTTSTPRLSSTMRFSLSMISSAMSMFLSGIFSLEARWVGNTRWECCGKSWETSTVSDTSALRTSVVFVAREIGLGLWL